jgi:hypothetical protein
MNVGCAPQTRGKKREEREERKEAAETLQALKVSLELFMGCC